MKVIYDKYIPPKGYKAINIFGVVFVREGCVMSRKDFNHERIHTEQMKEMLYVFFYLSYVIEFLIRLVCLWNWHKAYRNISFEREAYENEYDYDYINNREPFSWFNYL